MIGRRYNMAKRIKNRSAGEGVGRGRWVVLGTYTKASRPRRNAVTVEWKLEGGEDVSDEV